MKVCLYNFSRPGAVGQEAGGVGVYLQMLVPALLRRGVEVVTLNAGKSYSPWARQPYLRFAGDGRLHHAQVVNSPVIAPAHENFFGMASYLTSAGLDGFPRMLRDRYGHIDVFHFHNIEGLTLGFFWALREQFPNSVIVMTAHNYNLVCPQVNLWKDEKVSCTDYEDGHACTTCINFRDPDHKKALNAAGWFKSKNAFLPAPLLRKALKALGLPEQESARQFSPVRMFEEPERSGEYRAYRRRNVDLANACFDAILAVSERTRHVLSGYGVGHGKVFVNYIGSTQVDPAAALRRITSFDAPLRVAYLGYARRDKGFDFLLDALERLPPEMTKQVSLRVAARIYDERYVMRLRAMRPRFAEMALFDGYDRSDLPSLLDGVHLGIVPPVWEDNLPQVAIEFVARGIPILCSDMGGASELANQPDFTFRANSTEAFASRLKAVLDGRVGLESFWSNEPRLVGPDEHVSSLMSIYQLLLGRRAGSERSPQTPALEAFT